MQSLPGAPRGFQSRGQTSLLGANKSLVITALLLAAFTGTVLWASMSNYSNEVLKKHSLMNRIDLGKKLDSDLHEKMESKHHLEVTRKIKALKSSHAKEIVALEKKIVKAQIAEEKLLSLMEDEVELHNQRMGIEDKAGKEKRLKRQIGKCRDLIKEVYSVERVKKRPQKDREWLLKAVTDAKQWEKLMRQRVMEGAEKGYYGLKGASDWKKEKVIGALVYIRGEFVYMYKQAKMIPK